MENNIQETNQEAENKQFSALYLNNIQSAESRKQLLANHQELKIPIESYQYTVNALSNIPISDRKKEVALDILAKHYADKITTEGIAAFDTEDRQFAVNFTQAIISKRNADAANYFHENISNLMTRNTMVVGPHTELMGAYYHYIKAENEGRDVSEMEKLKNSMTEQIKAQSPEFFRNADITEEKKPELMH